MAGGRTVRVFKTCLDIMRGARRWGRIGDQRKVAVKSPNVHKFKSPKGMQTYRTHGENSSRYVLCGGAAAEAGIADLKFEI